MFDEGFQRLEDPGAQARFMGAAGDGRNQVDIRLMGNVRRAIRPPAQRPGRAFALGKTFVLAAGVILRGVSNPPRKPLFARFSPQGAKELLGRPGVFIARRRRGRFVAILAGEFAEIAAQAFRVAPGF